MTDKPKQPQKPTPSSPPDRKDIPDNHPRPQTETETRGLPKVPITKT